MSEEEEGRGCETSPSRGGLAVQESVEAGHAVTVECDRVGKYVCPQLRVGGVGYIY